MYVFGLVLIFIGGGLAAHFGGPTVGLFAMVSSVGGVLVGWAPLPKRGVGLK